MQHFKSYGIFIAFYIIFIKTELVKLNMFPKPSYMLWFKMEQTNRKNIFARIEYECSNPNCEYGDGLETTDHILVNVGNA